MNTHNMDDVLFTCVGGLSANLRGGVEVDCQPVLHRVQPPHQPLQRFVHVLDAPQLRLQGRQQHLEQVEDVRVPGMGRKREGERREISLWTGTSKER